MALFWVALILVIIVVVGSTMVLLRTARRPGIPDSVKAKPYQDDEGEW